MYSLDVNFIKDRPEYNSDKKTRTLSNRRLPAGNLTPLYLGLAAAVLLPALAGGGWLILQNQNAQLEKEVAQIDENLSRLGIEEQQIKKIQEETSQIKAESQALATVFNQIRPWSVMLQDIRDRIPKTVQIENIKQTGAAAPQAAQPAPNPSAPQAAPPAANPVGGIEISGVARSFNDVNDFLLSLQQSPFFKPIETRIVTAELIDNPITVAVPVLQSSKAVALKLPQVVRYTMQASLSDAQASELLRELERKGGVGLVTRIRTLQQRGVIQQ